MRTWAGWWMLLAGLVGGATVEAGWSNADLDTVLERHVDAAGRVDYPALVDDREALDRYVAALARTSPDSHPELFPTEADRLAYWMNAYNALMLHRVVDAWPVENVRKIRLLAGVFWLERHTLGGDRWSLHRLENKVIRARFGEPRIHFAINCASIGCPALPRRAWRGDTLDADLDAAARRFVADPEKVRIDGTTVHLSSIFKWFAEDFLDWMEREGIPHPDGLVDYVRLYAEPGAMSAERGWTVHWIEYDWSINAR